MGLMDSEVQNGAAARDYRDEVSSSESSSSSDSDSDDELVPAHNPNDTSDKKLTLVDDEDSGLTLNVPPENDGEGDFEEEGEGEGAGSGVDMVSEKKSIGTSESESEKPKKKKKKKKKWLYCCTLSCKYDSVRRCTKRYGFKEVGEDEDWNLYWTDYSVALERVMDMKKYQKINHFPGMSEICRKDLLARNMNRMLRLFPKEYNVFPRSWCLPADYGDFQAYSRQKKHKTYILKPESGCQGKGIWVTKNTKDIKPNEHMLCQQYVSKPFLIDDFKFDLRIYTLVTSCDPLRIFIFKDGLARFATVKYCDPHHHNVDNVYMHLTNYAINKNSSDFIRDDEAGSKRRISTINRWFMQNGYDIDRVWNDIDDVIIKTLISAHAVLKHNYRTCFPNHVKGSACFEILGFDVMFDKKLKPYLIEAFDNFNGFVGSLQVRYTHLQDLMAIFFSVPWTPFNMSAYGENTAAFYVNHSPSFHTDAKLDKEIKEAMIYDTLNLVNFGAIDKKKCIEEEKRKIKDRLFQRQNKRETKEEFDKAQTAWLEMLTKYEDAHAGNFRRIYPGPNTDGKYEKYFHSSGSLYQETAAFKARSECARQQREEILRKQEKMEMMLKKKKTGEMRPESPGSRRRRVKRGTLPLRRYNTSRGLEIKEVKKKRHKKERVKYSKANQCGTELFGDSDHQYGVWDSERLDIQDKEYRVHYTLAKTIKPYQSLSGASSADLRPDLYEPIDTKEPLDIVEEEELERISGLLQRDNLVRGLGIVEHVYRLLHCTPGTMSMQLKPSDKYHQKRRLPSLDTSVIGVRKRSSVKAKLTSLAYDGPASVDCDTYQALPARPKPLPLPDPMSAPFTAIPVSPDTVPAPHPPYQPQTSLPDSTTDIALSFYHHHGATVSMDHIPNMDLAPSHHHYHHHHHHDSASGHSGLNPTQDGFSAGPHGGVMSNYYGYNSSNLGTLHTTYNHALSRQVYAQGQGAYIGGQPGQMWKTTRQASSLAQVNDRGLQRRGSQRSNAGRRTNCRSRPTSNSLQQDERQLALLDGDNDPRCKLVYGRHGYEPCGESAHSKSSHRSPPQRSREGGSRITPRYGSAGTIHVQNAASTLTQSAPQVGISPYTYSFPVVKVIPQQVPSNLSVVSAPATVSQHPELVNPAQPHSNHATLIRTIQPEVQGLRSTKSQRIRGASNNIRVKQLEMRENHPGVVFT